MATEEEVFEKFQAKMQAMMKTQLDALVAHRNEVIYMLVDHRIDKGEYKPEEREQRFAEILATLELVEMKHFRPEEKLQ